ncbi:peptidoglycan-binding protein [Streptomyces sp. SPB162]|uniref:peptidoglycan-binding domain-containing protein n=1 Tax=Streptomyces sp. SPB162 TaxID=2940560 RepID=UPI0024061753|nr:peptidoglycan-binding protein [Streptomyces sp. SPB162]MDF9812907.1 peptidoglycan hydrolase-like protein with peptidoglycan-binding domain [Streptomyces sp. SPB162]
MVLPTSDATAAAAPSSARGRAPKASPTTTHRAPTTPVTTPTATVPPVSATPSPPPATVGSPAADPAVPGPDASPSATPSAPVTHPTITVPALRLGDTGAAVKDLQQRLRRAYVYMGSLDGVFDSDVKDAVATFQFWNAITGDPEGVYGPATRTALERQTSW